MTLNNNKKTYTALFIFEMFFSLVYSVTFNFLFLSSRTIRGMELADFFVFGCAIPGILLAFIFSIALLCLNGKHHLLPKSTTSLLCGSHVLYTLLFFLFPVILANENLSIFLSLLLTAAVIFMQIMFLIKFIKINPEKTYANEAPSNRYLTAKKSTFWIISAIQTVVAVYGALNFILLATGSDTLEAIFEKIGLETYYEAVGFIGMFCLIGISVSSVILIIFNSKWKLLSNTPYFLTLSGVVIWGLTMLLPSFISGVISNVNDTFLEYSFLFIINAAMFLIIVAQIYLFVELIKMSRKNLAA